MDANLVSALIGAGSGAAVAGVVYLAQRNQTRWQTTMALLAEFSGPEMLRVRREAMTHLTTVVDPDLVAMRTQDNPPLSQEERDRVWSLISFYERLSALTSNGQLADSFVLSAFGEVFVWWWEFSFKQLSYPAHRSAMKQIVWLHRWMERRSIRESRTSEFGEWAREGRRHRCEAIQAKARLAAIRGAVDV